MNDVASVAECDSLYHLVHVVAESLRINAYSILFKDLEQIFLYIFENQVQTAFPKHGQKPKEKRAEI